MFNFGFKYVEQIDVERMKKGRRRKLWQIICHDETIIFVKISGKIEDIISYE